MDKLDELAVEIKPERLSDIFLPLPPLASRRSDRLKFVFESSKSGRREREVTLHAVNVTNEGEIIFKCLCHESESVKSFRMTSIVSNIQCAGKEYRPEDFITEYLGVPAAECQLAVRKAKSYSKMRENFDKIVGEAVRRQAPVWSGNVNLSFKFKRQKHDFTLQNVYLLKGDDLFFWGYSGTAGKMTFIPYADIESKITAGGQGYTLKTFPEKFLGLRGLKSVR